MCRISTEAGITDELSIKEHNMVEVMERKTDAVNWTETCDELLSSAAYADECKASRGHTEDC